jgi:sterol desaturase/sphingolipid hydroxylase (fatty acid hydroxylase superfamily)
MINLLGHLLVSNIIFDYLHNLYHKNKYLKKFHYKHHYIKIPYCIDTFIAHPIDNIFVPILSDLIPYLIVCYIPTGKIGIIISYQANMIFSTIIHSKYKISNKNAIGSFFEKCNWLILGNHSLHHYNKNIYHGNDPISNFLIKKICKI